MGNIFLNVKLKKYILIISMFILLLYGLAFPYLNAENIDDTQDKTNYALEYRKIIEKYIDDISLKIKDIDDLILYMKSQNEYNKYPAVRLNMQTPFLGISAIVENKLQIVDNVSIFDRTSSYSIRDIVKKKTFKIPSFSIASIVIFTKDLNIYDSTITKEEISDIILLLQKYSEQVDDVYVFVENQRNNIFFDYVSKDIKTKLEEYKNEVIKIQEKLIENDYKILLLKESSLLIEDDELNSLQDNYLKIYEETQSILEKLSNILISNEELENVNKKIQKLKEDLEKNVSEVSLRYDVEILNLNVDAILRNIQVDIRSYISKLNEYVLSSEIVEKIDTAETDKVTIKYEIKNTNLIDELKEFDKELESEIVKRISANSSDEYVKKVYTNEQEIEHISDLNKKYVILINKVKEFYKINSTNLLNINNVRIEAIIKYTNVSVSKYLNDLYFEISNNIKELDNKNFNSVINDFYLIKEYKDNLENILKYSEEIYNIYSEKLKNGEIKS